MSESTNNSTSPETSVAPAASASSWKLPEGIEDHIEAGLFKATVGVAAGGVVGMIMFRSGKGMRAASVAAGVGVAAGSTYERLMAQYGPK
mmetsp:Transcript_80239/g.223152  ORF Transcript_80239/g.223152 Transcript_80239/m.223152 type:complete len:90 (-) Transcript_80239:114-383(-)